MRNIAEDHKYTIGASQAHRICTCPQSETLPTGAINFIEDMVRLPSEKFADRYESPSMKWGIEQEPNAIARLEQEFDFKAQFTGDEQKRLYASEEYPLLSALPDGIFLMDDEIIVVEIKCLNTYNHEKIIKEVGDNCTALKYFYFAKWVQCQAQMICVEQNYQQNSITSILTFYDPRSRLTDLHYLVVKPDYEFREFLKKRLKLASALYQRISNELNSNPIVFDGTMPKTQIVKKSDDFEVTPEILKFGLDSVVSMAAEHFGVKVVDGHFIGGDVFNCETQEGRDLAKKAKNKVTKIRSAVLKLNQPITKSLFADYKKSLAIDQGITEKLNSLRDHLIAPLTEWEKEQERIQQEQIEAENEKKRLADEAAAKVRQAILDKIERLKVFSRDVESIQMIERKIEEINSIEIDALFGEFEEQARQIKFNSIIEIETARKDIEEQEKQKRLDDFEIFKAKCDALIDPLHSAQYLESRILKLGEQGHFPSDLESKYIELINETIKKLTNELIPDAKQRAIEYAAEQNKAQEEARKQKEALERLAEFNRAQAQKERDFLNDWDVAIVENKLFDLRKKTILEKAKEQEKVEKEVIEKNQQTVTFSLMPMDHKVLAIYKALNEDLYLRIIDIADSIDGYLSSETQASYLHNLFGDTKQEKELKKAFIEVIKSLS